MSQRATPAPMAQPMLPEGLWKEVNVRTRVGASPEAVACPAVLVRCPAAGAGDEVVGGPCSVTVLVPEPQPASTSPVKSTGPARIRAARAPETRGDAICA